VTLPSRPALQGDPIANFEAAVDYLRRFYAYLPLKHGRGLAVPIDAAALDAGTSLASMRDLWMSYRREERGPQGGRRMMHPIDTWAATAEVVASLQCRPDRPTPLFDEGGRRHLNTWHAPGHPATGGSAKLFLEEFLPRLIPDDRSREWCLDRDAYKLRHPWVPGIAVLMVGQQGAGRTTLYKIKARLIGEAYTTTPEFEDIIRGRFNSFLAKLWVFVPETSMPDESRISGRRNAMDKLKYTIDTQPRQVQINNKYGLQVDTITHASYDLSTNHNDVINEPTRRVSVIENGEPQSTAFYGRVQAWADNPRNIGALYRYLASRDLSQFDPYQPLETDARRQMIGAARTEIEDAVDEAIAALPAEPMQISQVQRRADFTLRQEGHIGLTGVYATIAGQLIRARLAMVLDTRPKVFARTSVTAARWRGADPALVKAQLKRNDAWLMKIGSAWRIDYGETEGEDNGT
jgi:hypothetical protein